MHAETLTNQEQHTYTEFQEIPGTTPEESLTIISEVFSERASKLESLKEVVSLKLFHALTEKIQQEEIQFNHLLNLEQNKQNELAEYSFVLDKQFFEQKLLRSE